jgi:hypothetical protein
MEQMQQRKGDPAERPVRIGATRNEAFVHMERGPDLCARSLLPVLAITPW